MESRMEEIQLIYVSFGHDTRSIYGCKREAGSQQNLIHDGYMRLAARYTVDIRLCFPPF